MRGISRQRPSKAASAALQIHNQYTAALHKLIHEVCCQNDIGSLTALPSIGEVPCLRLGELPCNGACWNNLKSDCTHIVDQSSGFNQDISADKVITHADSIRVKQKQTQAAIAVNPALTSTTRLPSMISGRQRNECGN